MQPRHRGREAQPKPEPGSERLCSSRTKRSTTRAAVRLRNARAAVGDAEQDAVAFAAAPRPARSARRRHRPRRASGRAYLIALSTRLASAWLTSSRLPLHRRRSASPRPSARGPSPRPAARRVRRRRARSRRRRTRPSSSRACPDSARAIISSALKVRISSSDSSIVAFQRRAVVGFVLARCAAPPRRGCAAASAAS